MNEHKIAPVTTDAENRIFEGFLNRNLYPDGNAAERTKWFYNDVGSTKFLLFRSGVIGPIGAIGFSTRAFNTPIGLKMGAVAADMCIDKMYRDIQSALVLTELGVLTMLNRPGIDFVYTIPNRSSKGIIKRTGIFESAGTFQRHVKLVSFREVTEGKKYAAATPAIDAAWSGITFLHNLPWLTYNLDFGPNFAMANNPWYTYNDSCMVMGNRDTAYLNWRYADEPNEKYKVFHVYHKGKDAYIVYMIIKNRAYVVDLLYPRDDTSMLRRLFAAFEQFAHRKKLSMIVVQYLGCDSTIKLLEKMLYRKHKPTNKELFVSSRDGLLMSHLTASDKYWFAGDEDDVQ